MVARRKGTIDTSTVNTSLGKLLTPEQLAQAGTEHSHQVAFFQWIAIDGRKLFGDDADLLFAVPNGGDRKAHVGAAMKAEGVKRGVPDVCWPMPRMAAGGNVLNLLADGSENDMFAGLWIELKKPSEATKKDGGRSDEQVKWHKRLRGQGYAVVLAYGWQAMAWTAYLYWTGSLFMRDEDAFVAGAVEEPPVVGRG